MIWRSTYNESLGDMLARTFDQRAVDTFYMLWHSYRLTNLVKSCYFELIRLGDGKYNLIVQKHTDDTYTIRYYIGQKREFF